MFDCVVREENMSLLSERNEWEVRPRNSIDTIYSFRKENEHQLFILKHENEMMSNAYKQSRQMVNSLSQRLHCLQIAVESGVQERKKQEEYIHMLQVKIELQEQNKCVERLTVELDKNTQFPRRITEETKQKLVNALSEIAAIESNANCVEYWIQSINVATLISVTAETMIDAIRSVKSIPRLHRSQLEPRNKGSASSVAGSLTSDIVQIKGPEPSLRESNEGRSRKARKLTKTRGWGKRHSDDDGLRMALRDSA
ncbi:hypothetical protein JHK85_000685 [Glycine max]|nr:hypothetical protein JHK85_000685 [Glycine max]